jgi:hypothetical protein
MQSSRTQPTLRGRLAEAPNICSTIGSVGCDAVVGGAIFVEVGVDVVVVIVCVCGALLLLSTMTCRNMSDRARSKYCTILQPGRNLCVIACHRLARICIRCVHICMYTIA